MEERRAAPGGRRLTAGGARRTAKRPQGGSAELDGERGCARGGPVVKGRGCARTEAISLVSNRPREMADQSLSHWKVSGPVC